MHLSMSKKETPSTVQTAINTKTIFENEVKLLRKTNKDFTESYTKLYLREDGRAHIVCDLRKSDGIFKPFSAEHALDPDIYDYLEDQASYLSAGTPLTIEFALSPKDKDLQNIIAKLYRSHYRFDFAEDRSDLTKNRVFAWLLLVIGALVLVSYGLLVKFWGNPLEEIVSIFAWVFIWESCDRFVFERLNIAKKEARDAQMATAQLAFRFLKKEDPLKDMPDTDALIESLNAKETLL